MGACFSAALAEEPDMDEVEITSILDRIWDTCVAPFADENGAVPVDRETAYAAIEANLRAISAQDTP